MARPAILRSDSSRANVGLWLITTSLNVGNGASTPPHSRSLISAFSASRFRGPHATGAILLRLRTQPSFNLSQATCAQTLQQVVTPDHLVCFSHGNSLLVLRSCQASLYETNTTNQASIGIRNDNRRVHLPHLSKASYC